MKKLILSIIALLAFSFQAVAQSATTFGDAIEGLPFSLGYDHTSNYVTRLYKDGVQLKEFSISEITIVSTNPTTLVVTYKITVAGQPKGVFNFTATSVATATNGTVIESAPSNICTMTVRPNAPGQLRKL